MKRIATIAASVILSYAASAAFIRQATETYPGGGGGSTNAVTRTDVTNIVTGIMSDRMVPQLDDNLGMTASESLMVSNILQVGEDTGSLYLYAGGMAKGVAVHGETEIDGMTYSGDTILGPGVVQVASDASNMAILSPSNLTFNGIEVGGATGYITNRSTTAFIAADGTARRMVSFSKGWVPNETPRYDPPGFEDEYFKDPFWDSEYVRWKCTKFTWDGSSWVNSGLVLMKGTMHKDASATSLMFPDPFSTLTELKESPVVENTRVAYTNDINSVYISATNAAADDASLKYLSLRGGTVTGNITMSANDGAASKITSGSDATYLEISAAAGGVTSHNGSFLALTGNENPSETANNKGRFRLGVGSLDGTRNIALMGYRDGRLKWNGTNVVMSVNGVAAADGGNVTVDAVSEARAKAIADAEIVAKGAVLTNSEGFASTLKFGDGTQNITISDTGLWSDDSRVYLTQGELRLENSGNAEIKVDGNDIVYGVKVNGGSEQYGHVELDVPSTNGLASQTWVTNKNYVIKTITNGLASVRWATNEFESVGNMNQIVRGIKTVSTNGVVKWGINVLTADTLQSVDGSTIKPDLSVKVWNGQPPSDWQPASHYEQQILYTNIHWNGTAWMCDTYAFGHYHMETEMDGKYMYKYSEELIFPSATRIYTYAHKGPWDEGNLALTAITNGMVRSVNGITPLGGNVSLNVSFVTNSTTGSWIDADRNTYRVLTPASDWSPNEALPLIPHVRSKGYNRVSWNGTTWRCVEMEYTIDDEWIDKSYVDMLGDINDPNATSLEFPSVPPVSTSRTLGSSELTRLATTNDVGSASATLNQRINSVNTQLGNRIKDATNRVGQVEAYLGGQNVRVSVTNVNGSAMGDLPKLRIEENVSNVWNIVWDEDTKYGTWYTNATSAVAAMTNSVRHDVNTFVTNAVASKAPLAWGTVTSDGGPAPANTVWHTAGKTVFGGGTEFQLVAVGTGQIGVLVTKGSVVYAEGNPGTFFFETEDFRYHFGIRVEDSYMLGCNTDGITVTQVAGGNLVTLTYNVTMTGKPCLYYKASLATTNAWEKLNDSTGTPIPGASKVVSWEATPPAGKEICYIPCGTDGQGFFTACVEVAGKQTFETNLAIDPQGGILATNETLNVMTVVEPYISGGEVKWRIKP